MPTDPNSATRSLMAAGERVDPFDEELALAALERELFAGRTPAPVLDRYVLLGKIGCGGQGVVFRAYDPDLDRRVALKLLRVERAALGRNVPSLLAEARILAQVAHPNVITVHDVGAYTRSDLGVAAGSESELGIPLEGVFIVTELMAESLRDVLARRPTPRELMPLLLAAGRGIAAAHARGVVHRDFKPSNVLVSEDGDVRVADFGLALAARDPQQRRSPTAGTPAYMAPEQLRGGPTDARCDQYAFALTCYTALSGAHPFTGVGNSGSHVLPKARPAISRRLHAALARAMEVDPAKRYPDMPALLRALESAQSYPRRLATGAGVAGLVAAAGFLMVATDDAPPCHASGTAIDSIYNDAVRGELRESFAATGAPYAGGSWQSVQRALDEYAERWRGASRSACEDTHLRHVQSATALDQRTECLQRLRLGMSDAIAVMRTADPIVLRNAVQLVHGLEDIEACSDPRSDAAVLRMPSDPAMRSSFRDVYSDLSRARLLELSGRYAEAMALARAARAQAEQFADPGLNASALLRMGSVAASRGEFEQGRAMLLEGIQLAESANDHARALDGWTQLVWVAGVELQDDEADTWAGFARAALRRRGHDPMREAELVHNLGGLDYRRGRFEDALLNYQRALAAQNELLSGDDPRIARTLNHIANALLMMGENTRALSFAARSLAIRETVLGETHPLVAASLNNCASARLALRKLDAAEADLDRALEIAGGTGLPEEAVAQRLQDWVAQARGE